MRLVICHKGNDNHVDLYYPNALAAKAARNHAMRDAAEKRKRLVTFGPDQYGQEVTIHEDCLGSISVIMGDAPTAITKTADKKNGDPAVKEEKSLIIPAGSLPVPPGTPIRQDSKE